MRDEDSSGITLNELLVILSILCALFVVIVPTYSQKHNQILASDLADDFRFYASTLSNYSASCEHWPEISQSKDLPGEILHKIPEFQLQSRIGGHWAWSSNAETREVEILLVNHQAEDSLLRRLDHVLDDGNLATGKLKGNNRHLSMILRP